MAGCQEPGISIIGNNGYWQLDNKVFARFYAVRSIPWVLMETAENPVILFDGVCNLCNGMVQFVIRHDPKKYFHFASLQSAVGKICLRRYQLPTHVFNSFVLLENGRV